MGAGLAVPQPAAPSRRLYSAPRQRRSAVSQGAGALRPDGDGSLRAPRHFRRGQALPRRRDPSAQARYARLYHQDLRPGRPLRHHVHPRRHQLRPGGRGTDPRHQSRCRFPRPGAQIPDGRDGQIRASAAWRKLQGRSAGFGVACANFGERCRSGPGRTTAGSICPGWTRKISSRPSKNSARS